MFVLSTPLDMNMQTNVKAMIDGREGGVVTIKTPRSCILMTDESMNIVNDRNSE